MKNNNFNKILILSMLMIVCMTSLASAVSVDMEEEVIVDEVTFLDRIGDFFSSGTFTTIKTMGSFIDREGGELFDLSFRMRCQASSNSHKFSVGFSGQESEFLDFTGSQVYNENINCEVGKLYDVTLTNVKTPSYNGADCGALKRVRVKHETSQFGTWLTDTDEYKDINGYEVVATLQVECVESVCEGLTGKSTGGSFCSGNDVVVLRYTDIVKNGECVTNNRVLENCGSDGCSRGSCREPEEEKEEPVQEPVQEEEEEEEEPVVNEPDVEEPVQEEEEEEEIAEDEEEDYPYETTDDEEDKELDTEMLFYIITGAVVLLVVVTIIVVETKRRK
jgi:hypothetical protein